MADDLGAVQLSVDVAWPAMRAAGRAVRRATADARVTTLDPPHVSLGWPWQLPLDVALATRVARTTTPVLVRLDEVDVFDADGRGRRVVHLPLDDEAEQAVAALAERLGRAPDDAFTAHVSLVRVGPGDGASVDDLVDAAVDAAQHHLPGRVVLDELVLTARRDGSWREVARLRLAGSAPGG